MFACSRTLFLLKITCEFSFLKSMNQEYWEELLSRLEFANLPDWNRKILLEKMIDPIEVVVSEATV